MAVDADKAYKICIAMGNSPEECAKKRDRAKSKKTSGSWHKKRKTNKAVYKD